MIKNKQTRKTIAVFLLINFLSSIAPYNALYANNNGPNAPEASGFEPVSATDMVNLSSGDMAYVLPLLEVDGFPVTLSYHAGIPMEMEASWTGLGWNINTGSIARGVVATPDDWNEGRRLNVTYLHGETTSYSVDVGVGLGKAASVGVGLSWGPNKALSGSVSASIGMVSASMDTSGNAGVSLNASSLTGKLGFKGAFDKIADGATKNTGVGYGGSLSFSTNGGFSASAGLATQSSKGLSTSMGISVSGNGVGGSFSIGGNNSNRGSNAAGGSGSMSMSSFTAGDFSINTRGFYIPINIGIFSFGFGQQKVDIKLRKAYNKYAYGSLYLNEANLYRNSTNLGEQSPDGVFKDYQKRNRIGDSYEQIIPQEEADFISDYRKQVEKLNFTFAGYDSYNINATGVSGSLRPIIGENAVILGEGFDGGSTYDGNKKAKVFYHNSYNTLRSSKSIGSSNLHFAFDGQITQNAIVGQGSINTTASGYNNLSLGNFINNSGNTINNRPRAGSFIEVFTNEQIDGGANIIHPSSSFDENNNKITRTNLGYQSKGIGAYKITTPDGKTYHFSQPVYQYEQIQHNFLSFDEQDKVSPYNSQSKREATPYATHWLLTAITGPDFIDNGNSFPDKKDLGYWVRLDHGQWSSGYAWRSPYDTKKYTDSGVAKNYSTYIDDEVEKADPGHFMQGRKDLYYLDKIVTKEQVANFVKDIRYDGIGTDAPYDFAPTNRLSSDWWNPYSISQNFDLTHFNDPLEGGTYVKEHALYEKEYLLKLDKIVITKNNETSLVSTNPNQTSFKGLTSKELDGRYDNENGQYYSFIANELGPKARVHKLHRSNKVLDVDDFNSFDYSKASKVIAFEYDYSLAKNSPSSNHPNNSNRGRLTLKEIKTYGRNMWDYMPPYKFTYHKADVEFKRDEIVTNTNVNPTEATIKRANVDNWGFINGDYKPDDTNHEDYGTSKVDAWSLKTIKTPQGSTIEVNYEEDNFKVEAFARKYWKNNLQFKVEKENINGIDNFTIRVKNQNNFAYPVNFKDYFKIGERVFLDLWINKASAPAGIISSMRRGKINILPEDYVIVDEIITVNDPTNTTIPLNLLPPMYTILVLKVKGNHINDIIVCGYDTEYSRPNLVLDLFFDKNQSGSGRGYVEKNRGSCVNANDHGGGSGSTHTMSYSLLANKVAPGTSGGGLRVKEIITKDEQNNQYITEYDYNDPATGKTSGITSFNPTYGEVFVPYQNELPGPGTMYEWVSMKAYGVENGVKKLNTKMRYHYYTLQPVWDIFNPNILMKDKDGDPIFKGTVVEESMNQQKTFAKKIKIEKNLTKIGQLISTEEFNSHGHLLNKSQNFYKERIGEVSETFSSMKSVFDFNLDDEGDIENHSNGQLKGRYLSLSTKSEKVSVVHRIDNYAMNNKTSVQYSNPDPYLGTYRTSERTMADGTKVLETKYPAYQQYATMGSKINNINNKNMLTQEAMNVTSVKIGNNWKATNASVTTWNNDWTYRDDVGNETSPTLDSEKVWRKHKTYVWKDNVDANGTYGRSLSPNDFKWGVNNTQTNDQWQNVSEITRYTHYSSPIETRDINNNFASSKMADNWSKTVAGGNARYTEMYYSGAENVLANGNLAGEILGVTERSTQYAHTGKYSLKVTNPNSHYFKVNVQSGNHYSDLTKNFRPGKYKVSVWTQGKGYQTITLNYNNQIIPLESSVLASGTSGYWTQLNYIVDVVPNANTSLYFTGSNGSGNHFDDFRMHPIASSMNSYVYDELTDELTYVLDANNLATKYEYDNAGRLSKVYKEVINDGVNRGGYKLVKEYNYNYKH